MRLAFLILICIIILTLIGCTEKTVEEECIPTGFSYGYYDINECFARFAAEKDDISICYSDFFQEEFTNNAKCLSFFAKEDNSLCETANNLFSVDECYYYVAINTSNAKICELVKDKTDIHYTECLGFIAVINKNISTCHGVSNCEEYYNSLINYSN